MTTGPFGRSLKRTASALRYDIVFQWRHGFYWVYAVIVALYVLSLRFSPAEYRRTLAILLVFTDTSVLGFFFIGGIVLLERSQNTFESLFITPLRIHEYLLAKVISLTLIALVMSLTVVAAGVGFQADLLPLALAVALGSVFFTLAGIMFASRVRSVNGYFGVSILLILVMMFPLSGFFGLADARFFAPFPTQASLVLLEGSFRGLDPAGWLYGIAVSGAWIAGAWMLASSWFRTYVLVQIGEEKWKIV